MLCYRTIKAGTLDGLPYYQLYFKELRLQGTRAALSRNFARRVRSASDLLSARYPPRRGGPRGQRGPRCRTIEDPHRLRLTVRGRARVTFGWDAPGPNVRAARASRCAA